MGGHAPPPFRKDSDTKAFFSFLGNSSGTIWPNMKEVRRLTVLFEGVANIFCSGLSYSNPVLSKDALSTSTRVAWLGYQKPGIWSPAQAVQTSQI
jgi:hypothetical protein